MPVAASRLAEVSAGDAQPLEIRWRGEHLLEQQAILPLLPSPPLQGPPGIPDARGEAVTHLLGLTQPQRPRHG